MVTTSGGAALAINQVMSSATLTSLQYDAGLGAGSVGSFTYEVNDGQGGAVTGTVQLALTTRRRWPE